jgi:hypothetical protein
MNVPSLHDLKHIEGFLSPVWCVDKKGNDIKFKKIPWKSQKIFTFCLGFVVSPKGDFRCKPNYSKITTKNKQVVALNYTPYELEINKKKYLLIDSKNTKIRLDYKYHMIAYHMRDFTKILCLDVIKNSSLTCEKRIFIKVNDLMPVDAEELVQYIDKVDLFAQIPHHITLQDVRIQNLSMQHLLQNIAKEADLSQNPLIIYFSSPSIKGSASNINEYIIFNHTELKISVDIVLNLRIKNIITKRLEMISQCFVIYHLQFHKNIIFIDSIKKNSFTTEPRLYFELKWSHEKRCLKY